VPVGPDERGGGGPVRELCACSGGGGTV
jgi:hypothetical protein